MAITKFRRGSSSLKFVKASIHNLNADISYIPSYPSLSNEVKMYAQANDWKNAEYHSVELLGMSKDIDEYIKMVNPSPDPYLDYDKIVKEFAYGRVYEDYNPDEDKSFKTVSNPSLNPNSPKVFGNWGLVSYADGDDYLQYTIKLATLQKVSPYTAHDYEGMKLLVYNKNTLGKDPYLMSDLMLVNGREVELAYSDDSG